MRLIDADELKKSLQDFPYGLRGWVFNIIENQPTLDGIMRCKDCKNYDLAENGCNGFCSAHAESMYPWDYCSLAERKES